MKYKIGDRLLIKSRILPYDEFDRADCDYYRVGTSCSNGYDRFSKEKCKGKIKDGYVIHEVFVKSFDTWAGGNMTYHCTNDLSVTGYGWQGVKDIDVIRKLHKKKERVEAVNAYQTPTQKAPEMTITEYTKEQYDSDMKTELQDDGLLAAIKKRTEAINEECGGMGYVAHRTIQELLCEIEDLVQVGLQMQIEEDEELLF